MVEQTHISQVRKNWPSAYSEICFEEIHEIREFFQANTVWMRI